MASNPPGTGHPDGEARGMPHGAMLQEEVAKTVALAGTQLITGGFWEVGGYRSLVVAVKNTGLNDVTITPAWDFIAGSAQIRPSETQTVAAGTSRRLLFQNQGDILPSLVAKGVGGASTITYYLAPANLDPLPSSTPDTFRMRGVRLVIPAVAGGYSGESPWDAATIVKTGTDIWATTLDGSGHVVEVLASAPGLYEMWFSGIFEAPSAFTRESLVANVFGTIPLVDQVSNTVRDETAGQYGAAVGLLTSFASGAAQFSAQVDFDRITSGAFTGDQWWIKHWSL